MVREVKEQDDGAGGRLPERQRNGHVIGEGRRKFGQPMAEDIQACLVALARVELPWQAGGVSHATRTTTAPAGKLATDGGCPRFILAGMSTGGDEAFCAEAGGLLAALPGVRAVALGGSRAWGTAGPDSDWDLAVYYRGAGFGPASLRSLGRPGEIFPICGWGGGVFNGGAW